MKKRNGTAGRITVEEMSELQNNPTLVHFSDGSMAIQHPLVKQLMDGILDQKSDEADNIHVSRNKMNLF